MKRHVIGLVFFLFTLSLGLTTVWLFVKPIPSKVVPEPVVTSIPSVADTLGPPPNPASNPQRFVEIFSDNSRVGQAGRNKVQIFCFDHGDLDSVLIKFYARGKHEEWEEKQSFEFEKDNLTPCDPQIEDFNNDGLKDFTYRSNVAARGANEVRTLFIYDKKKDELIYIKNSENYPNLAYNKKLDCVDAFAFHGATTTIFLRIEGDMLREFASVGTGLERIVTVTRKDGTEVILRREKMDEDDIYTRYSRFDPPRP